jgi:hypothetical protein
MPAAADDDGVIGGFGFGLAPEGFPALVAAEGVAEQREAGEAFHEPSMLYEVVLSGARNGLLQPERRGRQF